MIEFLTLPLELPFLQRALLATTLVAVPMALLSAFLVLRGWSLMGDAIAHAVLPGVVVSFIAGLPLIIGAFAAGMICALLTGYVSQRSRVKEDTVMGVVFSSMFALGIVLYGFVETEVHLDHILFGNMLGITWRDLGLTGLLSLAICVTVLTLRRDLTLQIFDPTHGRALGLPMARLHLLMLALVALSVVAALSAVGLILAIGLLIAPAAIALLWTNRFPIVLILSVLISVCSAWIGIYLSVYLDSAPAPTIVVVLTACFVISFLRPRLPLRRI
ncbi:MAG: metal ABC transporter permease [Pseudomonadota bacterium]